MSEFDLDLDLDYEEQTVGAFGAIPKQTGAPAEKDDDPFNFANIDMSEPPITAATQTPVTEAPVSESQISSFGSNTQVADDPFDFSKPMETAPLEYASPFDIEEAPAPVAPFEAAAISTPIELMDDDFDEGTVGAFAGIPTKVKDTTVASAPTQNTNVNAPNSVQDINNAFRKPAGAPITPVSPAKTVAPTQNTNVNAPNSVQDINNAFRKPGTVPEAQPAQPGTISLAAKAVLQKEMEKTKKSGIKMLVGAVVLLLFFPISIPLAIGGAGKLKKASQIKKQIEQG